MDYSTEKDELGHLIKKRNQQAFHELYKTSFNRLQKYAMRYLYDWDEAEDLVQDAFLSLWSHPERYNEKLPVFYYLLGIVRNNCMNYLRDLNIQYKHQDKIIEAMLFSSEEMNISEATVKTHFQRALAQLRSSLKFILFGL